MPFLNSNNLRALLVCLTLAEEATVQTYYKSYGEVTPAASVFQRLPFTSGVFLKQRPSQTACGELQAKLLVCSS